MEKYIMAFDAGTTSNRCLVINKKGEIISKAQKELKQYYPKPGWVEQDADEIWSTQLSVAIEALSKKNISSKEVAAIGITNQRETVILWDKKTGRPVYRAIVWQCRRTAEYCDQLRSEGFEPVIREKTGLILDAYFSGTKIRWILKNVPEAMELAKRNELLFGTVETWLVWKLTKGRLHITDYSNASRTMLYNINSLEWDKEILDKLEIPYSILPEVVSSSEVYGKIDSEYLGNEILISGMAGDQQAALFGHGCLNEGQTKNTYGTGCFMLMNTGDKVVKSENGLLSTIAWGINGKVTYALEGSVFIAGAAVKWLKDEMKLISDVREVEESVNKVPDTNGCVVVPAFTGLGAPYWDAYARGTILGITRGVNKHHVIRATLESIAFQVTDILKAMEDDSQLKIDSLYVDGGASASNFIMQEQADQIQGKVMRQKNSEMTALGAGFLAGLAIGFWKDTKEVLEINDSFDVFECKIDIQTRNAKLDQWHKGIKFSKNWEKEN